MLKRIIKKWLFTEDGHVFSMSYNIYETTIEDGKLVLKIDPKVKLEHRSPYLAAEEIKSNGSAYANYVILITQLETSD